MKYIMSIFIALLASKAYSQEMSSKDDRVIRCLAEDKKTEVYMQRSDAKNKERSLWIEVNHERELVWSNVRSNDSSIATNRGVRYREVVETVKSDKYDNEVHRNTWQSRFVAFVGEEPDPYQGMEFVKVAVTDDVLVMITRTKVKMSKQADVNMCYSGGFFSDHLTSVTPDGAHYLPPHSDYSFYDRNAERQFTYGSYVAPWSKDHGGYEYFLRSFIKNKEGKWSVHVSAAVSVLWADSLSLPIKSLSIVDKDTYSVTFDGKYEYFVIDANKEIEEIYDLDRIVVKTCLFDHYGELEKLIYRGEKKVGETVEMIKYIDDGDIKKTSLTKGDLNFKKVYTTLRGGEQFFRVAYDKDTNRLVNSWVGYDELSDAQVNRFVAQSFYGNMPWNNFRKMDYGYLVVGLWPLDKDEVRQTYTLPVNEAKQVIEARIKSFLNEETFGYVSMSKEKDFIIKRFRIYLRLIEEAMQARVSEKVDN